LFILTAIHCTSEGASAALSSVLPFTPTRPPYTPLPHPARASMNYSLFLLLVKLVVVTVADTAVVECNLEDWRARYDLALAFPVHRGYRKEVYLVRRRHSTAVPVATQASTSIYQVLTEDDLAILKVPRMNEMHATEPWYQQSVNASAWPLKHFGQLATREVQLSRTLASISVEYVDHCLLPHPQADAHRQFLVATGPLLVLDELVYAGLANGTLSLSLGLHLVHSLFRLVATFTDAGLTHCDWHAGQLGMDVRTRSLLLLDLDSLRPTANLTSVPCSSDADCHCDKQRYSDRGCTTAGTCVPIDSIAMVGATAARLVRPIVDAIVSRPQHLSSSEFRRISFDLQLLVRETTRPRSHVHPRWPLQHVLAYLERIRERHSQFLQDQSDEEDEEAETRYLVRCLGESLTGCAVQLSGERGGETC